MAEFTVMKGFLDDFSVKGGETPETLPPDPGSDVTDQAKVDPVADHPEGAKGGTSTTTDDLTMEKDVSTVESGAKRDVKDGYTEDIQAEKINDEASKGFNVYNRMVEKGFAVETEHLNKWNIGAMVDSIAQNASDTVAKEMGDSLVEKSVASRLMAKVKDAKGATRMGRVRNYIGNKIESAAKYIGDKKPRTAEEKYKLGKRIVGGTGAVAAGGAGAYAASKMGSKKKEINESIVEKSWKSKARAIGAGAIGGAALAGLTLGPSAAAGASGAGKGHRKTGAKEGIKSRFALSKYNKPDDWTSPQYKAGRRAAWHEKRKNKKG